MLESDWDKSIGPYVSVKETVMRNKLISTSKMQHRIYWLGNLRITLFIRSPVTYRNDNSSGVEFAQKSNPHLPPTTFTPKLSDKLLFHLYSCGHGILYVKFMSFQKMSRFIVIMIDV
jgi:hypothetical protein